MKKSLCFSKKYITSLLLASLITLGALPASANIYVSDIIGRFLPTIKLEMEPGAYEKIKILPGNKEDNGGMLAMTFEEERDFYGFSLLICDEVNAKLYERRKSASCFRKEIDLKSDVLKYKFKGSETYYAFVVNRSKPLRTNRTITITPYIYTAMNKPVRERLIAQLDLMNKKLEYFFGIDPLNFAVIPCQQGFVPSSIQDRTLTICSEMMLGEDAVPDKDLMLGAIFYELVPFLENEWGTSEVKDLADRMEFTSMLIMLFSKDKQPFIKFLDLITEVHEMNGILAKYPQHKEEHERDDYVNELIDVHNDPFTKIDQWLNISYDHMTNPILEKIREGEYRHYGFLRDSARIVLKRRYEQELRAKNPKSDEPQNIISDFW